MRMHLRMVIPALFTSAAAIFTTAGAQTINSTGMKMSAMDIERSGVHDFDFFIGRWNVHHRRLKERLVNCHDWVEFEGTTLMQTIMGGTANIDDNVLEVPGDTYLAASLRAFDSKSRLWSIWWLDGRSPGRPLDPAVKGSFQGGVGTFYADDTLNGKAIRIRFVWSNITPTSARWAQSFSADGGQTWETNWIMDFVRAQ